MLKRKSCLFDENKDKDIIEYINNNVHKKFTEYVRDLIREDMNKANKNTSTDIVTLLITALSNGLNNNDINTLLANVQNDNAKGNIVVEEKKNKSIDKEEMGYLNKLLDDD